MLSVRDPFTDVHVRAHTHGSLCLSVYIGQELFQTQKEKLSNFHDLFDLNASPFCFLFHFLSALALFFSFLFLLILGLRN